MGTVIQSPAEMDEPIMGIFGAQETVLHWHGDAFDLPEGAVSFASSPRTRHQAFRWGERTWGLLFHVEADARLLGGELR